MAAFGINMDASLAADYPRATRAIGSPSSRGRWREIGSRVAGWQRLGGILWLYGSAKSAIWRFSLIESRAFCPTAASSKCMENIGILSKFAFDTIAIRVLPAGVAGHATRGRTAGTRSVPQCDRFPDDLYYCGRVDCPPVCDSLISLLVSADFIKR